MIFKNYRRRKDLKRVCRTLLASHAAGLEEALSELLQQRLGVTIEPGEDLYDALARRQGVSRDQVRAFILAIAAGKSEYEALRAGGLKGVTDGHS